MLNISTEEYYQERKNFINMSHKGKWQENYVEYLLKYFPEMKQSKILDHGYALGAITSTMIDKGMDAIGVEPEEYNIKACPFNNLKGRLFASPNNQYPFIQDNSIDFIHSSQVVEHIPEDQLYIVANEFGRILKPNGILYIATPGECSYERVKEMYAEDPRSTDITHISCFGESKWDTIFLSGGLKSITKEFSKLWEKDPMKLQHNWIQYVYRKEV